MRADVGGQVAAQLRDDRCRDADRPGACTGLGRPGDELPGQLDILAPDADRPAIQVDIAAANRDRLTPAQAGEGDQI
jgi:hypothetical protein